MKCPSIPSISKQRNIISMTLIVKHSKQNIQGLPRQYILFLCTQEHSMARANLNKSEQLVKNTSAASKYILKRPSIEYLHQSQPYLALYVVFFSGHYLAIQLFQDNIHILELFFNHFFSTFFHLGHSKTYFQSVLGIDQGNNSICFYLICIPM